MKLDLATEQPISKPQDSGETGSNTQPIWRREQKPVTKKELLRRQYKELFGYKPCGLTEPELERQIAAVQQRSARPAVEVKAPSDAMPTIGEAMRQKKS